VHVVLGMHVHVQGCFYHLTQSTWRKVQELGLVQTYRSQPAVKHFCGMRDGLAFLPIAEVPDGLRHLRQLIPTGDGLDELQSLVDYFDATYVSGSMRRVQRPANDTNNQVIATVRLRHVAPLFEPAIWNVHDATLASTDRTNNQCESCNNSFGSLVGNSHPPFWVTIEALQQDSAMATTTLVLNMRGQPPVKRVKRSTKAHQGRLS